MRWMSLWARSSLYWVVYEKDYAGARHPLMQLIWLYQENTFPTGEVVSAKWALIIFYGQQSEMFSFYRIPKVLFTDERFWNISTDAKLLYGILLDRMNLSAKNGWMDEAGRVYIFFTIEEIKGSVGCAEKKAVKLLDELERKCGLIERKRQGLGKPNSDLCEKFCG